MLVRKFLLSTIFSIFLFSCTTKNDSVDFIVLPPSTEQPDSSVSGKFMNGADISYFDQLEQADAKFYVDGKETNLLQILKMANVNWVRLRLWVDPKTAGHENWCSLERTLQVAKRIKAAGFDFLLDIHYSDWWADPKQQTVPAAWKDLQIEELCSTISEYTEQILEEFKKNQVEPEMVQVGNEISNGMLWPIGSINDGNCTNLMKLIKSGCNAVRKTLPYAKIMLHLDKGGENDFCKWWFGEAKKAKIDFDIIGLSYYPFWHGNDLSVLCQNIKSLIADFAKEVCVVETSYPWTFEWADERTNNVWKETADGKPTPLVKNCPATPEGQKNYLKQLLVAVKDAGGTGVFWWEPDGIAAPNFPSDWENLTWFDFSGNWLKIGF